MEWTIKAETQDGDVLSCNGTREEMERLYNEISTESPDMIRTYHVITLYRYDGMGIAVHSHLTREVTRRIYNDIRGTLIEKGKPLCGVEDEEIAGLIRYTVKAVRDLESAFIAYDFGDRADGCWVFEEEANV